MCRESILCRGVAHVLGCGHRRQVRPWRSTFMCTILSHDGTSLALLGNSAPYYALSSSFACVVFALIRFVSAQGSVEELRNSYNFLQAGLSTLAAAASVALCLARGRLDSEMNVVDFLTMCSFRVQNKYGSKISTPTGNNGSIIGVTLGPHDADWNANTLKWIAHNTWAQDSSTSLVKLCKGIPTKYDAPASSSAPTSVSVPSPATPAAAPTSTPTPTPTAPTSTPTPTGAAPTRTAAPAPTSTPTAAPTSTPTLTPSSSSSVLPSSPSPPHSPATSPPSAISSSTTCACWHIPSIAANAPGRGGLASLQDVVPMHPVRDPQCYRMPSYQCHLHGQAQMPTLHDHVQRQLASGTPLYMAVQGPSQLFQYMLDDENDGKHVAYFFGVDNLGARTLRRMVSESMATQDASKKGRTTDLVDWSLGRLELSEKPDVSWKGSASTVILVGLMEVILMFVLCGVFGLDPFVSSLGARRGIRSLRLGEGGVTVFADLWLLEVKGYTIQGWENTPVLRVRPRSTLRLWYLDATMKIAGLLIIFAFWIACVFGYAHPLGLKRTESWANEENWSIYLGTIGTAIGFFSSAPMTGELDRFAPTMRRGRGYHMLRLCWAELFVELALAVLRIVRAKKWRTTIGASRDRYWVLLPCWYVAMETGVWLQWLTSKRIMLSGPHSQPTHHVWSFTMIQAGAFARATVLAAVSGSWRATGT